MMSTSPASRHPTIRWVNVPHNRKSRWQQFGLLPDLSTHRNFYCIASIQAKQVFRTEPPLHLLGVEPPTVVPWLLNWPYCRTGPSHLPVHQSADLTY